MQYSAFISYNHRDVRWARWLHRAIETYSVPKRLLGREARFGPVEARLPPVFRDRDELATSADLAEAVKEALARADTLIVVCSPAAVASRWVNEEIRTFTALGRRDRIRCLIVDGEPNAADPARECLPPALFENGGVEPLAADVRKGQDGKQSARLKLIAGILDLPYDELRQRETARRQRRLAALAFASSMGFILMAGLTVLALVSRSEAVEQRDLARQRTITAERTTAFVKSMFEESDPSEARGASVTAREVLDRGAEQIRSGLAQEPAVRAELGVTLGEVYGALGLFQRSDAMLRWASTIRHGQPGIRVRQLAALADSKRRLGDYEAAIPLYERAIAIARSEDVLDDMLPRVLIGLAEAQTATGGFEEADRLAREALGLDVARLGGVHPHIARDYETLGLNALYSADYAAARPLFERALAIRRRTEGDLSPSVADNLNNLGSVAYMLGNRIDAERYIRSYLAIDEKVLGPNHPDVATTLNNLARLLIERRAFAQAAPMLERAVAINLRQKRAEHDDMAFIFANLALAQQGLGRDDDAETNFERALRAARAHSHRNLGPTLVDLANLRCRTGRASAGLALLGEADRAIAADYPDDPWRAAWSRAVRGECLWAAGDRARGGGLIRESAPVLLDRWEPDSYYRFETERRSRLVG